MINFEYRFSSKLTTDIKKSQVIINSANEIQLIKSKHPREYDDYKELLNDSFILKLIFCKPKLIKKQIKEIFEKYPLLADRFNPRWNFEKYTFDFTILSKKIKGHESEYRLHKNKLLHELTLLSKEKNSLLANYFISELAKSKNLTAVKRLSFRIRNVCYGRSKPIKKVSCLYPKIFHHLENIFNYELLRKNFGLRIIKSSNVEICPYCNKRSIECTLGKYVTATPDLDHFYPKSKYPFLSISLYNLVPSCNYCNQKFKHNRDTYPDYLNPLVEGIEKQRLFSYIPGTSNTKSRILLNNIAKFNKNIDMFELETEYNSNRVLQRYSEIEKLIMGINAGLGNVADLMKDKEFRLNFFQITRDNSSKKIELYKFKIDMIRQLTGFNFKS